MKNLSALFAPLLILGCQTLPDATSPADALVNRNDGAPGVALPARLHQFVDKRDTSSLTRQLAARGLQSLDAGKLDEASALFNTALSLDLGNSNLQFLNALTYHLMGVGGDAKKFTLAEQGYRLAQKFDDSNWLARYYLGLAYLDQRRFDEAQAELAGAAVMNETDAEVLYDLAYASYYARDPRTAHAALDKLGQQQPTARTNPRFVQAFAVTNAALDRSAEASALARSFGELDTPRRQSGFVARRIAAWDRYHEDVRTRTDTAPSTGRTGAGTLQLAQVLPKAGGGAPVIPGAAATGETGAAGASPSDTQFVDKDMAVVDVVIIGTQEDLTKTKGLNLLSGLQLQFGDPLTPTSGFSIARTRNINAPAANSDTTTITSLISLPSVTYSLNIFNTLSQSNEILARPSLVALAGERSEFFSGVDVVAAAVSGGDGSSVSINKEIGVKLSVTPEFLPGDQVRLEVEAERTFLTTPSSSIVFDFRLDTSKTTVNANVVMGVGETLVLSGLSEEDSEDTRDSVPLLGDLPVVQYLFAKQSNRRFRKSVIILLTPRRAHYVHQDPIARAEAESRLSDFERAVLAFENRNRSWFMPRSTMSDALEMARNNSLFSEFRTGDFALENWHRRKTHEERLRDAVEFLFY